MNSKTKIIVLRMKELIYTGIFIALGILLIILLLAMFLPDKDTPNQSKDMGTKDNTAETLGTEPATEQNLTQTSGQNNVQLQAEKTYIPGIYTTQLVLNDQTIEIEVIVDQSTITSLRIVNLSEAVATMYPLLQPTFDSISEQIYEQQSVENIAYDSDNKYTSLVLLEAVKNSLDKAKTSQ